jgi:hypothetical protein
MRDDQKYIEKLRESNKMAVYLLSECGVPLLSGLLPI